LFCANFYNHTIKITRLMIEIKCADDMNMSLDPALVVTTSGPLVVADETGEPTDGAGEPTDGAEVVPNTGAATELEAGGDATTAGVAAGAGAGVVAGGGVVAGVAGFAGAIVATTTGERGAGVPTTSASAGTVVVVRETPETPVANVTVATGAAAGAGVAPS
jgi:hypothetical protein